jgi:hypothetical protein
MVRDGTNPSIPGKMEDQEEKLFSQSLRTEGDVQKGILLVLVAMKFTGSGLPMGPKK